MSARSSAFNPSANQGWATRRSRYSMRVCPITVLETNAGRAHLAQHGEVADSERPLQERVGEHLTSELRTPVGQYMQHVQPHPRPYPRCRSLPTRELPAVSAAKSGCFSAKRAREASTHVLRVRSECRRTSHWLGASPPARVLPELSWPETQSPSALWQRGSARPEKPSANQAKPVRASARSGSASAMVTRTSEGVIIVIGDAAVVEGHLCSRNADLGV